MKIKWIIGIILLGAIIMFFLSRENRNEVINRIDDAAHALNGSNDNQTPRIVKETQRKERARQNTTWTIENQALHPVEYCQAQLEEVAKMNKQLDIQFHQFTTARSSEVRKRDDADSQIAALEQFLAEAKASYRAAEAQQKWPVVIRNVSLSQELAQEKIIEAANRLSLQRAASVTANGNIARLDKKIEGQNSERRKLVAVRERLQLTVANIKTRKILDGEKGISDAMNAINDSLSSLSPNIESVALDDLLVPDTKTIRQETFKAIMSQP